MYHPQPVAVQQRGGDWPGSPHMLAHRATYSPSPPMGPAVAGPAGGGGGGGYPGGYRQPRSPAPGSPAAAGPYRIAGPSSVRGPPPVAAAPPPAPQVEDGENFAGFGTRRLAQKMAQQAETNARQAWEQREYERQLAQYEEEKRRYEEEARRYEEEKRRYEEDSRRYAEAQRQQAIEDRERRRRRDDEDRDRELRARQEQERAEDEKRRRRRRREEEEQERSRRQRQEEQEQAAARAERQALVERQRSAARMRDEAEQRRSPGPPPRSPEPRSGSRSPFHHHDRSQASLASTTTSGSGGSLGSLRGAIAVSASAGAFEKRPGAPERSITIDSSSSVGLAYDREPSRPQSAASRHDAVSVSETTPRAAVSAPSPSSSIPTQATSPRPQIQLRRPSAVGLGIDAANQRLPASIRETLYDDDFEEGENDDTSPDTTVNNNRYTQYGGQLDVDVSGDTSRASTLLAAPAEVGLNGRSQGRRSMALATVAEPSPMAKCADCGQNIAFEHLADHACDASSSAPPMLSPSSAVKSPFFDKYAAVHANGRSLGVGSETRKGSSFAATRSNTLDPSSSSTAASSSQPLAAPHRPRDLDLSGSTAAAMRSPPIRAFTSPMLSPGVTSSPLPPDATSDEISRAASERRKYIEQQREAARRGQLTPTIGSAGPSSPLPALRVDTTIGPASTQRSPRSATPASASRLGASPPLTAEAASPSSATHYKAMSSSSSASSAHSSLLGPSSGQRRTGHPHGAPHSSASGGLRSPSSAGLTPSSSYDVLSEGELATSSWALKNKSKALAPAAVKRSEPPQRRDSSDSNASSEADLDKLQDLLTDLESSARARAESRASSNAGRSRSHSSAAGSIVDSTRSAGSHSGSGSGSISSNHSTHSRSMSRASDATSQPLTVRGAPATANAGGTTTTTSRQPSPSKPRAPPLLTSDLITRRPSPSSMLKSPVKPVSPSRPVAPVKLCCVCLRSLTSSKLPFVARDGKFFCADDYADLYLPKCRKCLKPVQKNAVKSSDGALTGVFHRECFRCFKCDDDFLAERSTFYCFENAPYCSQHYHELAGTTCKGCGQGIEGRCRQTEKGDTWHPHCLRCQFEGAGEFCQEALDDFFVIDGKRLCEWHAKKTQKAMERAGRAKFQPSKRSTKLFNV